MTPNSIKALITLTGRTQTDVATAIRRRGIGCSVQELNQTIHGDRENSDIRKALSDELGVPLEKLFDHEFIAVVSLRQSA
jgi:hypothetical protein